MEDTKRSHQKL